MSFMVYVSLSALVAHSVSLARLLKIVCECYFLFCFWVNHRKNFVAIEYCICYVCAGESIVDLKDLFDGRLYGGADN